MKIFKNILFIFALFTSVNAQNENQKWQIIQDTDDQVVFLDTSSIRMSGDLINLQSVVYYKEPREFSTIPKKVSKIKRSLIFNQPERKYSVVGAIYYGADGMIAGSESEQAFSGSKIDLFVPVQGGSDFEIIYDNAKNYLMGSGLLNENNEYSGSPAETEEDSTSQNEEIEDSTADSEEIAEARDPVPAVVEETQPEVTPSMPEETNEAIPDPGAMYDPSFYDFPSEQYVRDFIYTDGKYFCFQISSWRSRSNAESEAAKLKRKGYNSYIQEAIVNSKGGRWFRVRVGLFGSEDSATKSYKSLK